MEDNKSIFEAEPAFLAPHEDPRAILEAMLISKPLTEADIAATEFKDEHFATFMTTRIREMVEAGFPIPTSRLEEIIKTIQDTPIYIDRNLQALGEYNSDTSRVTLRELSLGLGKIKWSDEAYFPLHELGHKISGHTLSEEYISKTDRTPAPAARVGLAFLTQHSSVDATKRALMLFELTECINQTFVRWLVSDERPNFREMTCGQFFDGPKDVFIPDVLDEINCFAESLDKMPMQNLVAASYEDFSSYNAPRQRAPMRKLAMQDLETHIRGGIYGLTYIYNSAKTLVRARARGGETERKAFSAFEIDLDVCINEWKQAQSKATDQHGEIHITRGNTRFAAIVPGPAPTISNLERDATLQQAREVFPLR